MKTLNLTIATLAIAAVVSTSAFAFGQGGDRDTSANAANATTNTYVAPSTVGEIPAQRPSANDALLLKLGTPRENHQSSVGR